MSNQEYSLVVKSIKESFVIMANNGVSGIEIARQMSSVFGNALTRLVLIDLGLDRGLDKESKAYFNQIIKESN